MAVWEGTLSGQTNTYNKHYSPSTLFPGGNWHSIVSTTLSCQGVITKAITCNIISKHGWSSVSDPETELGGLSKMKSIFTARKRSLRRLCFHRHLVCPRGDVCPIACWDTPPLQVDSPPGRDPPWQTPMGRHPQ